MEKDTPEPRHVLLYDDESGEEIDDYEDENRVVTIADISIVHTRSCNGWCWHYRWDIGGIGFTYKKEETKEAQHIMHGIFSCFT
jgi:hypothetical protein